ncbi:MAG: hypothetical protein JWQ40_2200 [Segetibacter sp.]|jgi:hypothetical protein|nr:hypothetical protein [Segetibacter sp.]
MKNLLGLIVISALAVLTGCSNQSYPGSSPYPTYPSTGRNDDVIVTRDGTVIDRNGRVIGNTRNMPPGQAKKIYGSKSAKRYSRGHRDRDDSYDNREYRSGRGYDKGGRGKYKSKGRGKN